MRLFHIFNTLKIIPMPEINIHITGIFKDPLVIDKILTHLDLLDDIIPTAFQLPGAQGPPSEVFF
ncbi:MAG: hypothetical protein HRU20_09640 [Pseudomonadales bacterium]|nr:hypothetical protein [Pseudomonadales bacterium]